MPTSVCWPSLRCLRGGTEPPWRWKRYFLRNVITNKTHYLMWKSKKWSFEQILTWNYDQSIQWCLRICSWGRYLGLRWRRWQGNGEDCIMRNFILCTPHQILFRWSKQEEWDGRYVTCVGDRVLVGRPEGRRPLGRRRHRWEDNIKMDLIL